MYDHGNPFIGLALARAIGAVHEALEDLESGDRPTESGLRNADHLEALVARLMEKIGELQHESA